LSGRWRNADGLRQLANRRLCDAKSFAPPVRSYPERHRPGKQASFPDELAEMCLAHLVGSEVERAYRRSELIAKRRELLTAWADYCASGLRA